MSTKSLRDPLNFLALTTVLSVAGTALVTSTTKMSEQIPNAEQVELINHALSQSPTDATRYPTLSQAETSHKLGVFAEDNTLLEEWTVTIDPSLPPDESAALFADMATALANFVGEPIVLANIGE